MGAAQSTNVPDVLAGVGELVTEEECRQLAEQLGWPEEKFEDFWEDAVDEEATTISKKRVQRKLEKVLNSYRKSHSEAERRKVEHTCKGQRIYDQALSAEGVDRLSALPEAFRHYPVPKDSPEGKGLEAKCNELLQRLEHSFQTNGDFSEADNNELEETLPPELRAFFEKRIQMYGEVLSKSEAIAQVRSLLEHLEKTYLRTYDGTFHTEVTLGQPEAYARFTELSSSILDELGDSVPIQSRPDLSDMYFDALGIMDTYNAFVSSVAEETGGIFKVGPLKKLFRTVEKTAIRPGKLRYRTDGILDIVRGTIEYTTIEQMRQGLLTIWKRKDFEMERLKDRLQNPTPAGWRDLVINGFIKGKGKLRHNKHRVEIQIHLESLAMVRDKLGGHFIYAKLRALVEAFEVTFGAESGNPALPSNGGGTKNKVGGRATKTTGNAALEETKTLIDYKIWKCLTTFLGHSGSVRSAAFSPDGDNIISGSTDNTLKMWSVSGGDSLKTFQGHRGSVFSVASSPDGRNIISGSGDNTLKLWSVSGGACLKTFQGHKSHVRSVALSPNGRTCISGSLDRTVKLWSVSGGAHRKNFRGHLSHVTIVAFSPDGRTIISGSYDKTLKQWSVSGGVCFKTFKGHTGTIWSVAFSLDGKAFISGSGDKTLKLWSVSDGKCLKTFHGHSKHVNSVDFSPDGRTVVSGSFDNTVKLWSVSGGECLKTFQGHTYCVHSVAFSPDGKSVVSGSEDHTLKLWGAPSQSHPQEGGGVKRGLVASTKEQAELQEKVNQLTAMGFDNDACMTALMDCDGNINDAIELLLVSMHQ